MYVKRIRATREQVVAELNRLNASTNGACPVSGDALCSHYVEQGELKFHPLKPYVDVIAKSVSSGSRDTILMSIVNKAGGHPAMHNDTDCRHYLTLRIPWWMFGDDDDDDF